MTSGGTSDGQVGAQQGSHRATALRPRRLVGEGARDSRGDRERRVDPVDHGDWPGWRGQDGAGAGAGRGGGVGGAVSRLCVRRLAGLLHRAGADPPEAPPPASRTTLVSRSSASSESIPGRRWSLRPASTFFRWTQGRLGEGIGWLERAREAALDAPAELRATSLFCEGFLVAHDTDDRHAAARLIDVGLDAIAGASEPPLILATPALLARRVRRLQRRPHLRRRSHPDRARDPVPNPGTWGRASACGTRPTHGRPSGTRTPRSRCSWR